MRLLKKREGKVAGGAFVGLRPEKTSFNDLASDLLSDYRNNARKALENAENYVKRLREHSGGQKAAHMTTDQIRAFIASRRNEITQFGRPPSNATINRELAALKRMFNLGKQAGKVVQAPFIPMLRENNVRKGFFSPRDYRRLYETLPAHLKPLLVLAYYTGMRKGEMLGLVWPQADFQAQVIRLEPGETKNKDARIVPMPKDGELCRALREQRKLRDARFPFSLHVFFYHSTERSVIAGDPIKDFRGSWATACRKTGLSRLGEAKALFHDLRRTGVRNLIRAGVSEVVAMAISGHKTQSVFDRHNVVDEDDVVDAGKPLEFGLKESRQQGSKSSISLVPEGGVEPPRGVNLARF